MIYEKICKLIYGVIECEFENVQEFREMKFSEKDEEQQELENKSLELMDKLVGTLSEEQKDLLDELDRANTNVWINMCRFYFKEGVAAGLTNLKFLDSIGDIGSYFR